VTNGVEPEEQEVCKQRPDCHLSHGKYCQSAERLGALKPVEIEKPEGWPKRKMLALNNTNPKRTHAQDQDPDCDEDRPQE
jgi:hypothetical protein